jgi:C4-dicarboxylate-specific signal transduction histidine kinase
MGESPSNIPIVTGNTLKPVFDWRQLQRWNISETSLPSDADIRFREPTIWERFRTQVLVGIAVIMFQAGLIAWLLYEKRWRHQAQVVARNAMIGLTEMNRLATAGELSACIAHEVKQPLTGMVANANAALRWLGADTPNVMRAHACLTEIVSAGFHASKVLARISHITE